MKADHINHRVVAEHINPASGQWQATSTATSDWEHAMKQATTWRNRADFRNVEIHVCATLPFQIVQDRGEYDAYVATNWTPEPPTHDGIPPVCPNP